MEIKGQEIRESDMGDGLMWEWCWPNIEDVERELRWTREAHKWVVGLRVGAHGWRTQECVGSEWDGIRSDDEAREQAEKFIERDIR